VAVAVTLSLFYSGVAWALAACLRSHDHTERAVVNDHHRSDGSFSHHQEPIVPVIHCALINEQIGPALRSTSADIRRPDKGLSLYAASPSNAVAAVLRNDLWLEALFKRIVTFLLPIDSARIIFLSVLRI